jgi:hypothetical protein
VSPQRFDKEKNVAGLWSEGFSRLFTGQVFIRVLRGFRDCTSKTHVRLRRTPGWRIGDPMVAGAERGQSRRRFPALIPSAILVRVDRALRESLGPTQIVALLFTLAGVVLATRS